MADGTPEQACEVAAQLTNEPARVLAFQEEFVRKADELGYGQAACFALRLAMEEGVRNALVHGHRDLPDTPVDVRYRITPETVEITIRDQGPGFDPDSLPDPTAPENLVNPSGRGVMLMRAYMTSVSFNETGNQITMVYERAAS